MTLDDFSSGKIGIEPSVFDRHFALPDTPFVAFQFTRKETAEMVGGDFFRANPGEKIGMDEEGRKLYVSRHGKNDTAHLLLDFIRGLANDGTLPRDDVEVTGLNEIPK